MGVDIARSALYIGPELSVECGYKEMRLEAGGSQKANGNVLLAQLSNESRAYA